MLDPVVRFISDFRVVLSLLRTGVVPPFAVVASPAQELEDGSRKFDSNRQSLIRESSDDWYLDCFGLNRVAFAF